MAKSKLKLPRHKSALTLETRPTRSRSVPSLEGRRALQLVSALCLAAALIVAGVQFAAYRARPGSLPRGFTLGGVQVGGLTPEQAAAQVQTVYASPVTLDLSGSTVLLDPASVSFEVDTPTMLAQAVPSATGSGSLPAFWRYLWRAHSGEAEPVPLAASMSEDALRQVLADLSARYTAPPQPARTIPWDLMILPAASGSTLDVDASLAQAKSALFSPSQRTASLVVAQNVIGPKATFDTLRLLIQEYTWLRSYNGLLSFTLVDLQTGEQLHFNLVDGEFIRAEPDVAVAATSAIKPLIMAEFYRERPAGLLPYEEVEMKNIVISSSNTSADNLMGWIGDGCWQCAFQTITDTGRKIGMENTFVGGIYFAAGAYEFQLSPPGIATPANQMTDFTTHPDPFLQTTGEDLAKLYTALYKCSKNQGGLLALFPDEFNVENCQRLIDWLAKVADPRILKRGVPDGTVVAHKHGFTNWVEGTRGPDTVGDAGIVYTPGGDYVLSVFTYRAEDSAWDEFTSMIGDVSRAVYNFYNPPEPIR